MKTHERGFTLVEVLVSVSILIVAIAIFSSLLITGWSSYQQRIIRADLWHEANLIIENMTTDVRLAESVSVTMPDTTSTQVTMRDETGNLLAQYTINDQGVLFLDRDGAGVNIINLSSNMDFANSSFSVVGVNGLSMNLTLNQESFNRVVAINTASKVIPRN